MASVSDLELGALAWVVILSAALLLFSLLAFRRSGKRRMLLLSLAFGFFLIKGLLATLSAFQWSLVSSGLLIPTMFDTAVLVSLYLATLR